MNRPIVTRACACMLAAALAPASAQQQTATGAQQFLAMLAGDGALFVQPLDKTTGTMVVQGTQTIVRRWLKNGVPQSDGPYDGVSTSPTAFNLSQMFDVTKAEGLDPQANADFCTTRLETSTKEKPDREHVSDGTAQKKTFFGYDYLPYRETITTRFEDPNVKYAGPYYVAWGKTVISRSTGWVAASVQDSRFNAQLFFKIKDVDMADRVEYAMKFLKASCDKTAATGF